MPLTSGWWRLVTPATLRADALAGVLGAVLVLPQAIAFATLAGLPPQYGIYSAIIPTIIAAAFGSSWHVVSGPTNSNSLALFAALTPLALAGSPDYITLALCLTVLVGIVQFGVGALRLGALADFIAPSVLLGFMSGAAALIALYALGDFAGIAAASSTRPWIALEELVRHAGAFVPSAVAIGSAALLTTVAVRRFAPKLPFMLIGLIAGWGVSELLTRNGMGGAFATVGTIPSIIPPFSVPLVSYDRFVDLLSIVPALGIVALGQSVSIAKAVALKSGQRIDINREFIGQGASNIAGGFFSAYLSCGSLNRSLPNYEAGARTPMAAMLAAIFLVALALVTAPLLARIPMPAVGALLLYTAWALFDGAGFARLFRLSRTDFAIAAITFASMLALPFHIAIGIGTLLSLGAYLHRTSHPGVRPVVPDPDSPARTFKRRDEFAEPPPECPQLKLLRMEGSIYYAATAHVNAELHAIRTAAPLQKHLLVMAKSMNFVDLAGADLWEAELKDRRKVGGDLYFHRPRTAVLKTWTDTGFIERLGTDHIFQSKGEAISHIFGRLNPDICRQCTARIFLECRFVPPVETRPPTWDEAAAKPAKKRPAQS
jgi:SulP family sulfate permease